MKDEKISLGEKCLIAAGAVFFAWLFFRYLLPSAVPVIAAWILSSFIRPITKFVSKKSKMPLKVCGAVIIGLLVFALAYLTVYLGGKLLREATDFMSLTVTELEKEDNFIRKYADILKSLPKRFPILENFTRDDSSYSDEIYELIISAAREAAKKLSSGVTSAAAGFIKSLPYFVFSVAVSIIALFYLTVDPNGIKAAAKRILPKSTLQTVKSISEGISGGIIGYVRAYFTLMGLTFAICFLGLMVMKIRYSFFLALVIAVVDALPILGSGSIILPWALYSFFSGNTSLGVGLTLLTAVLYVTRQFAEPRLVGHFLGIHPLITLIAAYLGFTFFGFCGMITAPVCLYVIRLVVSDRSEDKFSSKA